MSAVAEAIQAPSTNGAGPLMGSPSQQHHETAVADWLTVDPDQKFEETETELDLSNCEAKRVAAVIAHTAKFACKDTSRPVLMRLLCYADGQCLKFEATNSYMLAVIGANVEGKDGLGSFNFPFQIEGANATEIAKTLKKVGRFDRAKLSLNWGEGDFGSLEATVGTATARAQVSRNNAYGTFPDTQMLIKTALDRDAAPADDDPAGFNGTYLGIVGGIGPAVSERPSAPSSTVILRSNPLRPLVAYARSKEAFGVGLLMPIRLAS